MIFGKLIKKIQNAMQNEQGFKRLQKAIAVSIIPKKVDLEDLLNYASIGFDYETKAFYAQHFI